MPSFATKCLMAQRKFACIATGVSDEDYLARGEPKRSMMNMLDK